MEVTAYEIDIMVVSMSYSLLNETIIQSRMQSCRSLYITFVNSLMLHTLLLLLEVL